jgi:N-acetylneuraminate synthase
MQSKLNLILSRSKPYVIAEVAQAHEGSLGAAHSYIDAVKAAGVDAVKFQTHIAEAESTLDEPWRVVFSLQDSTRFDYWKRMEFTEGQWAGLAVHARQLGIDFISSPFSVEAVQLLHRIGVKVWKIPSGEINNQELLEAVWETRLPILYSTGMSDFKEIDPVIDATVQRGIEYGIFQCTSEYPCPPENWGLRVIEEIRSRYGCPVGISDHSGTPFAGLAASALGVDMIEVHVTFSRLAFGPDITASITMEELATLAKGARMIRKCVDSKNEKVNLVENVRALKDMFGRSLALREDLPAGTILCREHLKLKKPGTGIPFSLVDQVIGKKLRVDKSRLHLLKLEDLE